MNKEIENLVLEAKEMGIDTNAPKTIFNFNKDYVDFMAITDGLTLSVDEILSSKEREELNTSDFKIDFFKSFEKYNPDDYVLFASDGMGGYYAFKKDEKDSVVYYFDAENVDNVEEYASFTDYLKDIISMEKRLKEEL